LENRWGYSRINGNKFHALGTGLRMRVAMKIYACLFAGLFLSGCEADTPSERVGGDCRYRDIPGTCRFESIRPSGPHTYGEGFRTTFSFHPEAKGETSKEGARVVIGDGKDPTSRYLTENRIELGGTSPCVRRVLIRGPCSPEVFEFPGFKNVY
jgi:hypothetical protein